MNRTADHHQVTQSNIGIALRTDGLFRTFASAGASLPALRDINLEIDAGEYVAITGPSGSGKSTLLRALGGLDRGFDGEIYLDGAALSQMSDRKLSRLRAQRLGFIFQSFHLLPQLTVIENVLLPTYFHALVPYDEQRERARHLLDAVGLASRADAAPETLSGGQQQRVAIARALLNDPDLLLCDEPTGSLDVETGVAVMELLESRRREHGATLLVVTHEAHILERASRAIQLVDGQLTWTGPPHEMPKAVSAKPHDKTSPSQGKA